MAIQSLALQVVVTDGEIDLRDRSGLLQVVFDPDQADIFAEAERIRSEYVLGVRGRIRERPAGMINEKIPSGEVELVAEQGERSPARLELAGGGGLGRGDLRTPYLRSKIRA